jgi:mannose-6-phosphate isomerase-like protein (cupin superfamily)
MSIDPKALVVRSAETKSLEQTFSHPWNPQSSITGVQLGRRVGLRRTGVNFARVPPGKESFVYHSHEREEEWISILAGRAIVENVDIEVADFPRLGKRMIRRDTAIVIYDVADSKPFGPLGQE